MPWPLRGRLFVMTLSYSVSSPTFLPRSLGLMLRVSIVCFRVFWAAHPGWYLPPQLRGMIFNKKVRSSFASIELE